jgi:NhaP-type Na+/H+ or K+/H+ antiporter
MEILSCDHLYFSTELVIESIFCTIFYFLFLGSNADRSKEKRSMVVAVAVPLALAIILLASIGWFFIWKRINGGKPTTQI